MSIRLAVEVRVGAVPPAHLTVDHVTVKPPAPVRSNKRNDLPAVAVGIVMVGLPVRVMSCIVPFVRFSVMAVLELAVYRVSV